MGRSGTQLHTSHLHSLHRLPGPVAHTHPLPSPQALLEAACCSVDNIAEAAVRGLGTMVFSPTPEHKAVRQVCGGPPPVTVDRVGVPLYTPQIALELKQHRNFHLAGERHHPCGGRNGTPPEEPCRGQPQHCQGQVGLASLANYASHSETPIRNRNQGSSAWCVCFVFSVCAFPQCSFVLICYLSTVIRTLDEYTPSYQYWSANFIQYGNNN